MGCSVILAPAPMRTTKHKRSPGLGTELCLRIWSQILLCLAFIMPASLLLCSTSCTRNCISAFIRKGRSPTERGLHVSGGKSFFFTWWSLWGLFSSLHNKHMAWSKDHSSQQKGFSWLLYVWLLLLWRARNCTLHNKALGQKKGCTHDTALTPTPFSPPTCFYRSQLCSHRKMLTSRSYWHRSEFKEAQ